MISTQTLQDFVLNLLHDDNARAAFQQDPQEALSAAGLSDVTPADVQEVVPLVLDTLPVGNAIGADTLQQGLSAGAAQGQLSALDNLNILGHSEGLAERSAPTDALSNAASTGVLTQHLTGALGSAGDPAGGLDSLQHIGGNLPTDSVVNAVSHLSPGQERADVPGLGGGNPLDSLGGGLNAGDALSHLGAVQDTLGSLTGALHGGAPTAQLGGLTDSVTHISHAAETERFDVDHGNLTPDLGHGLGGGNLLSGLGGVSDLGHTADLSNVTGHLGDLGGAGLLSH